MPKSEVKSCQSRKWNPAKVGSIDKMLEILYYPAKRNLASLSLPAWRSRAGSSA